MYAYISQKIFLGKEREITSLTFDPNSDILVVGFNNGGVKLLKFEEKSEESEGNELQLILNENLKDTHRNPIITLSWNSQYGKLLSVDNKGLMIVWTESEDTMVEEMVNESDEKRIKFAKWSKNGGFIMIVIEKGSMILGSVEGERIWNKKLNFEIEYLDWLEEDKTVVVSDSKGEMVALDTKSNEIFAEYDVSEE